MEYQWVTQDKLHDLASFFCHGLMTWSDGEGIYELLDYKFFDFNRKYCPAKAKRASGGIVGFIRLNVIDAV